MARYTDELTTEKYGRKYGDAHFVVDANGGSVAVVSIMSDGTEIAVEGSPFTADAVMAMEISSGQFKITPTGGAAFEWST